MPVQTLTIARNAFVESIRQPIFFVLVMLGSFLQVLSTWTSAFSMGYGDSAEVSGDNKFLLDIGLGTVFVFGTLLAAFMATAVISREIERKTVLTVVSKPVPRPVVVIGKFLGVSWAILVGVTIMLVALLLGIRHGVMSTAADDLDGPVLLFGLSALGVSMVIGLWGNYMYGWYFSQASMVVLAPLGVVAYLLVLAVDKHWDLQPLTKDLKPQILLACTALTLGVLVLTSAAIAVSTRLSQVMTIVVCCGLLVMGLASNHLFGRHAFSNESLGVVQTSEPVTADDEGFDTSGAMYALVLQTPPREAVTPGAPFHYGPSPSGFPFDSPAYTPFRGDAGNESEVHAADPALIISHAAGRRLTVRNIGREPVEVPRPPFPGDYVFSRQTSVHPAYAVLWGVVPNMQHFWLLDAVAQNRLVPVRHILMIALYSAAQVGGFLALGVILFQKRDVG